MQPKTKMKIGGNINLFGFDFRMYFGVFKSFNSWKTGITNRCKDGQFVLFLDYDRVPIEWISDELSYIQELFGVGDLHVFKTSKGFHVINTEKRSFADTLEIMKYTSCDSHYIDVPLKYGKKAWTLRISDKKGKPKTKYFITFHNRNILQMSKPHNWLLRELYGVKISKKNEDGEKHFYKSHYPLAE